MRSYTKQRIGNVIDISHNQKAKSSKGYENWGIKHNLKTMAESIDILRKQGIKSIRQLDKMIKKCAEERQELQDKIKEIDKEMIVLMDTMEHAHNVQQYREHYKYFKANPKDKAFAMEYKSQLMLYEQSLKELKKSYDKMPSTKEILSKLD